RLGDGLDEAGELRVAPDAVRPGGPVVLAEFVPQGAAGDVFHDHERPAAGGVDPVGVDADDVRVDQPGGDLKLADDPAAGGLRQVVAEVLDGDRAVERVVLRQQHPAERPFAEGA